MITENRENGLIHLVSGEISFLVRTFEKKLPEVIYWGKPINIDGMGKGSNFNLDFLNPPMPIAVLDQPIRNSILPTRSYAYRGHQGIRGSRSSLDIAAKFEFEDKSAKLRIVNQALVCKWKISRTSLASTKPSELNSIYGFMISPHFS